MIDDMAEQKREEAKRRVADWLKVFEAQRVEYLNQPAVARARTLEAYKRHYDSQTGDYNKRRGNHD